MGLRLNKAIGYGLTDVTVEDYRITDPRINADSPLISGPWDTGEGQKDYRDWLQDRLTGDEVDDLDLLVELAMLEKVDRLDPYRTVTWNSEYGLPSVLLVRPAGFTGWHRHDDSIDSQEEMLLRDGAGDRVRRTIGGIHPFEGLYMDARTGERLTGNLANHARTWRRIVNELPESDTDRLPALNAMASVLGCRDHAEAEQCIVPLVPGEVRRICEWGGLFTGPDVWRQLRPLLYVYRA